MNYSTMRRCWDTVTGASREQLPDALRGLADVLGLAGTPGPALLQGEGPPHVLLAIANDAATAFWLEVIPESAVDDRLRGALATINRRTFAGAGDLKPEQWDAAVLVMTALANELGSADEMAAWAADEGSSLAPDEVAKYWMRWSGASVSSWAQLERPITAAYAYRRAM